jgi:hypothetical protein
VTKSKTKGEYVGVIDEGAAMFLNAAPGKLIETTVCAAVQFTGDKRIVQRGRYYRKGEEPKNLKATATRMAGKWNAYLARTGKRFELEQDVKKAKKAAKMKIERDRSNRARLKANDMAALLAKIVGHYDFEALLERETTGDRLCQSAREARDLLDYIANGDAK